MTLIEMLKLAAAEGFIFLVSCDDEIDYEGTDAIDALDAIEACDEMELQLIDPATETVVGWALICNDLDDDEKIADCQGVISDWME